MKALLIAAALVAASIGAADAKNRMTCRDETTGHSYTAEFDGKRLTVDGARFRIDEVIPNQHGGPLVLGRVNEGLNFEASFGERVIAYSAPGAGAALRTDRCR
jgi:hypothetical protein